MHFLVTLSAIADFVEKNNQIENEWGFTAQ
jgi:hypothetical protein